MSKNKTLLGTDLQRPTKSKQTTKEKPALGVIKTDSEEGTGKIQRGNGGGRVCVCVCRGRGGGVEGGRDRKRPESPRGKGLLTSPRQGRTLAQHTGQFITGPSLRRA